MNAVKKAVMFAVLTLSVTFAGPRTAFTADKVPAKSRPAEKLTDYSERQMSGFKVFVHSKVFEHNEDLPTPALDVLRGQFKDSVDRLPEHVLKELRRSTPIWVEWDRTEPDNLEAVAVYRSGSEEAIMAKGLLAGKANAVELTSLKKIAETKQPGNDNPTCVLLHELSHAWHQQVLGGQNPSVKMAFKQAMDRKLYESVKNLGGKKVKAYAVTNESEYFAELSEAYLGKNDYYPFDRVELKEHDIVGYRLMVEAWTSVESARKLAKDEPLAATKSKTDPPKTSGAKDRDEVAAQKKLDVVKLLIAADRNAEAREVIQEILKDYPETISARDASTLLNAIKNRK